MSPEMSSNRLTPESKAMLRRTVRELRESLIIDFKESAEQRYLLSVPFAKATGSLSADRRERRRRLESALDERAAEEGGTKEDRQRAFDNAVKEAGATLLNRLVLIRHLEAMGLSKPAVVTGGWKSPGYLQFREFASTLCEDDTQGYGVLLQLLFDELATALPGLFGDVGLTALFPTPPATLRRLIEALDEVPAEAWRDDMTLGWVYQYWNDPDREALDAKLLARKKIEPHEIAAKTQMFTERYMVEWLLQNSLGPMWLAICRKKGWTPDVESHGVLAALEERRAEWRKKREAGEVEPDALMPIEGVLEEMWKYYVPQPLPQDVVTHAPASIRELKLLDPACGSGHFLVVAFDQLTELYREEARHLGDSWSDRQIAEWILENNLHGVDIDPRAVQIAAAALFLKARTLAKDAMPAQVNLVAPALRLSSLDRNDPALVKLEADIRLETNIPPELTRQIIEVLKGVDHLGTLLKVGDAVDKAIAAHEGELARATKQRDLFETPDTQTVTPIKKADAKKLILDRLGGFLAAHAGEEDVGLRLRGQQLTAGLRFASIVREGEYHLVVGNPPYQGTSRMKNAGYVAKHYPRGKSDLFAAFLERSLELCRPGGASAMLTMRSWMFLSGFAALREHLLATYDLRILGDVDRGAFEEVPNEVLATVMSVFRKSLPTGESSVAVQPTALSDKSYDRNRTARKRAAILAQVGRFEFTVSTLDAVTESPLIYWWPDDFRNSYRRTTKIGDLSPAREGMSTSDNARFVIKHWEVSRIKAANVSEPFSADLAEGWVPTVMGAKALRWFEPLQDLVTWHSHGLEMKVLQEEKYGSASRRIQSQDKYFVPGVAYSAIGYSFSARLHRYRSIFGSTGSSTFPEDRPLVVCSLNRTDSMAIISDLNPSIHFTPRDVNRLPLFVVENAREIVETLDRAFSEHERHREPSFEFCYPGASPWSSAQTWAQLSVDRTPGIRLPAYEPAYEEPLPAARLSFRIGVALGRFSAKGQGVLSEVPATAALPAGILFLSARTPLAGLTELHAEWAACGSEFKSATLEDWLRDEFFDYHRKLYENRPIYFPLSSGKRSFVAYVSIHRWTDSTLSTLLADHLIPERKALEGLLVDLQSERNSPDKKKRAIAEKRHVQYKKWLDELEEFIASVRQCAEKGPRPDDRAEDREVDAPYRMNLDDGVVVNSAALWPLLEPMWKDPRKWWRELANAKGKKDYDWSHLAARYFPSRVDAKCRKDPSLAVAHDCFWKYHPEKAYQWELRLQDELGPDFKLNEKNSEVLRAAFLEKYAKLAREIEAAELARRERKARRQAQEELDLPNAGDEEEADEEAESE